MSRRRVLALPDRTDWALGFICDDLAEALDATHDITVEKCPKVLDASLGDEYDAIYVAYAQQYVKVPPELRSKTIAGVHSYAEYEGPRMRTFSHRVGVYAAIGCLAPGIKQDICHLADRVFWTPYGVPVEFSPPGEFTTMPDGRLRVGWAGNPDWGGRKDIKNFGILRETAEWFGSKVDLRIATDLSRKEMPSFYHGIDVLVVTSRCEGAPLPLMEALCCGIPVVTTHVGLADLHVQHGHNGWLYDGQVAQLRSKIGWLMENPNAVEDAKIAAAASPSLRWPAVADHWRAFLDSVIH